MDKQDFAIFQFEIYLGGIMDTVRTPRVIVI